MTLTPIPNDDTVGASLQRGPSSAISCFPDNLMRTGSDTPHFYDAVYIERTPTMSTSVLTPSTLPCTIYPQRV